MLIFFHTTSITIFIKGPYRFFCPMTPKTNYKPHLKLISCATCPSDGCKSMLGSLSQTKVKMSKSIEKILKNYIQYIHTIIQCNFIFMPRISFVINKISIYLFLWGSGRRCLESLLLKVEYFILAICRIVKIQHFSNYQN